MVAVSTEEERDLVEDIKTSEGIIGQLYPILLDANGDIIDGRHRKEANPNWKTLKLDHIDTLEKKAIAILLANTQRRTVNEEEIRIHLGILAQVTKSTPKELAKRVGMSYSWVMKYIHNEFKEKSWKQLNTIAPRIIRHEYVEAQKTTTSSTPKEYLVHCPLCNKKTSLPKLKENTKALLESPYNYLSQHCFEAIPEDLRLYQRRKLSQETQ